MQKKIKSTQMYRFVSIDKDDLKDSWYFMHPQALTRLGLFIIEANKKNNMEQKPIIIGVKNSEKQKYLVAGVLGTEGMFSSGEKNVK